jgi:hypothetical protein
VSSSRARRTLLFHYTSTPAISGSKCPHILCSRDSAMKFACYSYCTVYCLAWFIHVNSSSLLFSFWVGFWQEPESSQATGMALACCILGMFLGVVCHCFPLPLEVPTFAARCLHVPINASAPSNEGWNCGREWTGDFAEMTYFYAM